MDKSVLFVVSLLILFTLPIKKLIVAQLTNDCDVTYRCFRSPSACVDTACTFLYKSKTNTGNTSIDFVLYANVGTVTMTNKWIAIGFSSDAVMGGADDVIACKSTNVIERYSTSGRTLNSVTDSTTAISNRVISTSGTWLTCSFTRLITMTGLSNFYDLSTSYYALAAYGDFNAGTGVLSYHTARQPSPTAYSFKYPDAPGVTTAATITTGTIDTSDCGKTKGCFMQPSNCQGSACKFIFKYTADTSSVFFELYGNTGSISFPWLAIGFSNDQSMGDDGVCICSTSGFVEQRYNSASSKTTPSRLDSSNPTIGISNAVVNLDSGWLRCKFTRQKALSTTTNYFDLDKQFYILAASGAASGAFKAITATLSQHSEKVSSSVKANFNSLAIVGAAETLPMIKAHACLMIFAWMLFASTGIIFARYFKFILPNVKLCKVDFWFTMHRPIMISVPILSIIAFLLILAANQWSWVSSDSKIMFAHSIFGILAICLAIIQPFIAIARCDKDHKNRPIFNHVHRIIGLSTLLFSIVALFLGTMTTELASLGSNGWGIILGWTIWLVGFVITLEFIQMRYACKHSVEEETKSSTEAKSSDDKTEPENARNSGETVKEILLIVHVVVTLAFTIALVVIIGISS